MIDRPRHIGPYDVFCLCDGRYRPPLSHLAHTQGAAALARLQPELSEEAIAVDVNCFLLRGPAGILLVDAGCGAHWGADYGKAGSAMAALGVAPAEVRQVLVTHLHADHVLGLFEGETRSFPAAEILVPQAELAFFTDEAARETTPAARRGGFDLARKLLDIYGPKVRGIGEGPVVEAIEAVPLPGHTPGHTGYRIGEGKDALLIWGDVVHLGDLQSADPGLGFIYDLDPERAAATRRDSLSQAADQGWLVAGGHISGFARVERAGAAFRIV